LELRLRFPKNRIERLRDYIEEHRASLEAKVLKAGLLPGIEETAARIRTATQDAESLHALATSFDTFWGGIKKAGSDHSRGLYAVAVAMAHILGVFTSDELRVLGHAASFHDVGKPPIEEVISSEQYAGIDTYVNKIQLHSPAGMMVLDRVPALAEIAALVLTHHERMNRLGYPIKAGAELIPIEAFIIGVIDTYHAIMEKRAYILKEGRPKYNDEQMHRLAMAELWRVATPDNGELLPERWKLPDGKELPKRFRPHDYDEPLLRAYNEYRINSWRKQMTLEGFKKRVRDHFIRNTKQGNFLPDGETKGWYVYTRNSQNEDVLVDGLLKLRTSPEYQFPAVVVGALEYVLEKRPSIRKQIQNS
jgi:hypothetical protein